MTFLASRVRSAAPHTPRIVLLGPTGSGKSVQATLLANKYNIVNGRLRVISPHGITTLEWVNSFHKNNKSMYISNPFYQQFMSL